MNKYIDLRDQTQVLCNEHFGVEEIKVCLNGNRLGFFNADGLFCEFIIIDSITKSENIERIKQLLYLMDVQEV